MKYNDSGWVILDCCNDLAKYYRRSLRKKGLCAPPFGAHISVVAGTHEEPERNKYWNLHEGLEVEFEYGHYVYAEKGWYWLRVKSDFLNDVRESLGLKRELQWPLHLSVAKDRDREERYGKSKNSFNEPGKENF